MKPRLFKGLVRSALLAQLFSLPANAYAVSGDEPVPVRPAPLELAASERLITILQTNDIHGAVEPSSYRGEWAGGMAQWAGVVGAIRSGLDRQYGARAGVLVLDGGDQFQGTLISNYNEGKLVFDLMNLVGYDGVVPGNHDYDFGPEGWLEDRVTPENPDQNPRGVIERLATRAAFPLLAANVYYRDSLRDAKGRLVNPGADAVDPGAIDWSAARRPEFLKPYRLMTVAGVRVAIIGLDHSRTPQMTTGENVSDLYFRDEAATYHEIRSELEGEADVFVLAMHNGDASNDFGASDVVREILGKAPAEPARRVAWLHAVVAGHTHFVNNSRIEGIPIVQSGANGDRFGRIDLVWDTDEGRVSVARTRTFAGVRMHPDKCASEIAAFCDLTVPTAEAGSKPRYEGVSVEAHAGALRMIAEERARLEPISGRVLGHADGEIWRHRTFESPLSNAMTDALRNLSGADVAFMNTGGLRAPIQAGPVTYEELFRVLPFSNRAITVGPMRFDQLFALIERSVMTCGGYSALMASGLKVLFEQDCKGRVRNGVDPDAKILRIETAAGELLYDRRDHVSPAPGRVFEVATLDFLAEGGSGYLGFIGVPFRKDHGILREAMTEAFLRTPALFRSERDGRWISARPEPGLGRIAPRATGLMTRLFHIGD